MTVYVERAPGRVLFLARAEAAGAIGVYRQEITPGGSAFGRPFDDWAGSDTARFDFSPPPGGRAPQPLGGADLEWAAKYLGIERPKP